MKRISRALFLVLSLCGSKVALGQYAAVPLSAPGKISGKVAFVGPVPPLSPETRDKDPGVCGSSHANESLEVSSQGGLKNVVVYLKGIRAGKAMTPVVALSSTSPAAPMFHTCWRSRSVQP